MAEIYGKIFTKDDAEKQFGEVTYSVEMKTTEVKKLIENSPVGLLFKFVNGNLTVLNKQRQTILGTYEAKSDEVFRHFTTSVLEDLLSQGTQDITYFQMRDETFTIENGSFVLEWSNPCPPDC